MAKPAAKASTALDPTTIRFFGIEYLCATAKGQGIRKSEAMGKNEQIEFAGA
jgi:hypothetical protein